MYLYKKMYVKNWEHTPETARHTLTLKVGNKKRSDFDPKRVVYIEEEVMCWRKANAIHQWFVKNVQDGNDDCKEYMVSTEQLQELLDTCKEVLRASKLVAGTINNGYTFEKDANGKFVRKYFKEKGKIIKNPAVAKELLPTAEGFFFGSQDYDELYYSDIEETAEVLEKILADHAKAVEKSRGAGYWPGDFYYSSSW